MLSNQCKCGMLCPISLGLALGITYALAIFCCSVAMMWGYMPAEMMGLNITMTWELIAKLVIWGVVKGFIFGAILALLYDLFFCWTSKCRSSSGCGCNTNMPNDKRK